MAAEAGSKQISKKHQAQIDTHNVPGVSADVFITLVLALLSVTAILTAGVDMRPLDPRSTPEAPANAGFCCVCACVRVWEMLFPAPYSDNFLRVDKKNSSQSS